MGSCSWTGAGSDFISSSFLGTAGLGAGVVVVGGFGVVVVVVVVGLGVVVVVVVAGLGVVVVVGGLGVVVVVVVVAGFGVVDVVASTRDFSSNCTNFLAVALNLTRPM